ncbi:acyl carrier protein [Kitasatospora mediocidica]|uniref:acyl carrier protein n=1 Tax=Kitasatospora mediocidica TaxID=58352 RepID=UPI000A6CB074|nr:acyl carrier protein [Kitasatospora mediocidica]
MSTPALPDRAEVVSMLAAFGQRAADSVPETLGSLELTWLTAEFEQRYAVELELSDEQFEAVRTVDDAVAVLRAAVLAAAPVGAVPGAGGVTRS